MTPVTLVRQSRQFSCTGSVIEHLLTDKNSHVQKHLITPPDCKQKCTPSCFMIIKTQHRVNCRCYIFSFYRAQLWLVFTTQIVKYIFSVCKIKEPFYQANIVCGVFFMIVYVLQARSTLRAVGFSYSNTFNILARDTKCVRALLFTHF